MKNHEIILVKEQHLVSRHPSCKKKCKISLSLTGDEEVQTNKTVVLTAVVILSQPNPPPSLPPSPLLFFSHPGLMYLGGYRPILEPLPNHTSTGNINLEDQRSENRDGQSPQHPRRGPLIV